MHEANMVADILAKMGHNIVEDFVIFDCICHTLKYAYIVDIIGVEFFRIC